MSFCAPNIHAEAGWLDVGDARWRVSVTRPVPRNCYVVSATGQYLDYAREEIRRVPAVVARGVASAGMLPIAPLLRKLDPIVVLDALPVSTVLHASRSQHEWRSALDAARRQFAGLPIVIRSLDDIASRATLDALRGLGLALMPSRLVFHQDPRQSDFWRIRNVRHDVRLADAAALESRALVADDAESIATLYWQLYGEKHSRLNPRFSADWLRHGMTSGALFGEGILSGASLAAAYLAYSVGDMMTNPVFGYDTSKPQSLGLYRRLTLLTMRAAATRGLRIHASSGAPGFKASRGGVATLEYHAIDLQTVRGMSRAAWVTALRIAAAIGPAMLRSAR
jgi:hypothetical protein